MSKFCGKCGVELEDDATFCGACGAAVQEPIAQNDEPCAQEPVVNTEDSAETNAVIETYEAVETDETTQQQPVLQTKEAIINTAALTSAAKNIVNVAVDKGNNFIGKIKSDKKFMAIVIGAAVGVIALIILLCCLLGGGGYKAAIENYLDVRVLYKAEKLEKLFPKAYWDYMEEESDIDIKESIERLEELSDQAIKDLEDDYGKRLRVSFKVTEKDEMSNEELNEIKDEFKEQGIARKDVKKGLEIEGEITISGSEDRETKEATFYVVKIENKWYVYDMDYE